MLHEDGTREDVLGLAVGKSAYCFPVEGHTIHSTSKKSISFCLGSVSVLSVTLGISLIYYLFFVFFGGKYCS